MLRTVNSPFVGTPYLSAQIQERQLVSDPGRRTSVMCLAGSISGEITRGFHGQSHLFPIFWNKAMLVFWLVELEESARSTNTQVAAHTTLAPRPITHPRVGVGAAPTSVANKSNFVTENPPAFRSHECWATGGIDAEEVR